MLSINKEPLIPALRAIVKPPNFYCGVTPSDRIKSTVCDDKPCRKNSTILRDDDLLLMKK